MQKDQKSLFKNIKVIDDENIIYINKKNKEKGKIKIAKKLLKVLKKQGINKVVLSNNIKQNEEIVKELRDNNIKIFDGKWLIKYILLNIVNYILDKKQTTIETNTVAFLANNISDEVLQNIYLFSSICKNLTIVTNSQEKIKKTQEQFFDDKGIMLLVANNKKKTLSKKHIIINFDFNEEELNNYNINDEAIIINLNGNIKIHKKRFCGLNVNDYKINIPNFEKVCSKYINGEKIVNTNLDKLKEIVVNNKLFSCKEVYEALLFRRDNFNNIRKLINIDEVTISELVGINGKLF